MGNCFGLLLTDKYVEYSRDSFSHRICDDLCEVLLQYLSLEDKLRLEFVSKQFQRTVYKRHYELRADSSTCDLFFDFDELTLISLLKRLTNIKEVYLDNYFMSFQTEILTYSDWVRIISDHCPKLCKINCDFVNVNQVNLNEFIAKRSSTLKVLDIENIEHLGILEHFTNLQELHLRSGNLIDFRYFRFKKLRKLVIILYEEDIKPLQTFINMNSSINSLHISVRHLTCFESANYILTELAKFKHLVYLSFPGFALNEKIFENALTQMSLNCTKLKSIVCQISGHSNSYLDINELLSPLKKFKNLRRLDLSIMIRTSDEVNKLLLYADFIVRSLTGLEGLTHLTLSFYGCADDISEIIVLDILSNLKNLQYLNVTTDLKLTQKTRNVLLHLPKLKMIKLI